VEVAAPPGVVGKSLEALALRRRFRVNLVAIKRMETLASGEKVLKQFNPVPLPGEIIHENDILALVGSVIDLANFMGEYTQ
jgi:Trk K+ transport system NAD-binding subunit